MSPASILLLKSDSIILPESAISSHVNSSEYIHILLTHANIIQTCKPHTNVAFPGPDQFTQAEHGDKKERLLGPTSCIIFYYMFSSCFT